MLIQKTIATEFKAELQPSYVIWDMDLRSLCGNWPAHNTTAQVQNQGILIKDLKLENPWPKPHKPKAQVFKHFNNTKTFKKAQREK